MWVRFSASRGNNNSYSPSFWSDDTTDPPNRTSRHLLTLPSAPLGNVYQGIGFGEQSFPLYNHCNTLPSGLARNVSSYNLTNKNFRCEFYKTIDCVGDYLWYHKGLVENPKVQGSKFVEDSLNMQGSMDVQSVLCKPR